MMLWQKQDEKWACQDKYNTMHVEISWHGNGNNEKNEYQKLLRKKFKPIKKRTLKKR